MTRALSAGRRALLGSAIACGAARFAPSWAAARERTYPWRPVTIVQPFGAGNALDIYARRFAAHLAEPLGQPVIVETRTGAAGNIASDIVARAAPDGHTLLMHGVGVTLQPWIPGSHAVDPLVALAPVTRLAEEPLVVVVNPSLGVRSIDEFATLARRKPGLAYGTSGLGGIQHMAVVIFAQHAQLDLLHVPFSNSSQILPSLAGGDIALAFTLLGQVEGLLKTGRLLALAVTSKRRSARLPDIPTIAQSGYPDCETISWAGISTTAGTKASTVGRLYAEFKRVLALPDVLEMFASMGAQTVGNTPVEFSSEIRASGVRWEPIMRTVFPADSKPV